MVLTRQQEYVARWLDRVGSTSLRQATQKQGIERIVLDALVTAGRAVCDDGPDPIYRTTAPAPQDLSQLPPEPPPPPREPTPIAEPSRVVLSRQEERHAQWLRRVGKVSLRQALAYGIDQKALDLIVTAGRAMRGEGENPVYTAVVQGVEYRPASTMPGPARPAPPPEAPPISGRIRDLLSDGQPRSAAEVAGALCAAESNFIAQREIARDVQRMLPLLASHGILRRLSFGRPVTQARHGSQHSGGGSYDEKYVDASSVVPVCQVCFRNYWGIEAVPPQATGQPTALCSMPQCGKRTNDPSFVPRAEAEERS